MIEKNIPMPDQRNSYSNLLDQMKVGDSILMPKKNYLSFRQAAFQKDIKITARKQPCGNYRVWRAD